MKSKELQKLTTYIIGRYKYLKLLYTMDDFAMKDQLIYYVDYSLHQLDEDAYRIIFNDFIEKKHKNWWNGYYSRSTYYRLKGGAMSEFINCLNNQKMI